MKKLLSLFVLLSMVSVSSLMAQENDSRITFHITCDEIPLVLENHQAAKLSISKEGTFSDQKEFELSTMTTEDYSPVEVNNLKVQILKKQKFDEFQRSHFGFVRTKSEISVYAVKVQVSADEAISTEIRGCIPAQLLKQDFHLICREIKTTVLNP